jgi:hypothetical protein
MKTYEWVKVLLRAFLTSAQDGGEWSGSRPGRFYWGESPQYPLDRRLDGPKSLSGSDGEEKKIPFPIPGV